MRRRLTLLIALSGIPALADPIYFLTIRRHQTVRVILRSGYCDARVEQREADRLSLKLKQTSIACGVQGTSVLLARRDVYGIAQGAGAAAESTQNDSLGLAILGAGLGAFLAWDIVSHRGQPLYDVFAQRMEPSQP